MEACKIRTERTHHHIFWTDASIVFGACAAGAVVWKQPPSWAWNSQGFHYPYLTQSTDVVEMFAIAHALKRAVDDIKQSLGDSVKDVNVQITQRVFVFTDSIAALTGVENEAQSDRVRSTSEQARTIIGYSVDLDNLGAKVELHLVPGHTGVPGNDRAHKAAYEAAKHAAAAAGITSTEQGWAMHKNEASVVMFPGTAPPLVPATPVPAGSTRGSRKRASLLSASPAQAGSSKKSQKRRASLLSQPQLWKKPRAKTPPMLVPPLDPTDEDEEELVNMKGKRSKSIPGPHSVRPDRTPEPAPVQGPSFTSINAGSRSTTGFTPINASSTLSTGSPAKVSSVRIKWSALNPRSWFMPVDARPRLWGASSSSELPKVQPFGPGQLVPGPGNEPVSIGKAASFLGLGQSLFSSGNNMPAAVLKPSAVSKTCSESQKPARTPGSKQSSPRLLHWSEPKNSEKAAFGETALSSFIPQGNQPAAKTSAFAAVSFCLDSPVPTTNAVLLPAFNQASFPAPKPFEFFSPRSQPNHSPNSSGDVALPPPPVDT
jgi:ribonuclease HI